MQCARIFENKKKMKTNNQLGITWKLYTGDTIILEATYCLSLKHLPIKFHEDIPRDNIVIGCTRKKIKQNRQLKTINWQ